MSTAKCVGTAGKYWLQNRCAIATGEVTRIEGLENMKEPDSLIVRLIQTSSGEGYYNS